MVWLFGVEMELLPVLMVLHVICGVFSSVGYPEVVCID